MKNEQFHLQSGTRFRLGEHWITPSANEIGSARIDKRVMAVLMALVDAAPDVVPHAVLLERVWCGVVVIDNVVHQAISQLRKALGDSARAPRYIETIPRLGYRVVAAVERSSPSDTTHSAKATGDATAQSHGSTTPARICVLPFINMNGDPEQEYLSDGISEDIIIDLSKVPGLSVIGRSTAFTFKGKPIDATAIGRQLRVGHILEGGIRRAGGRIRITTQLTNASTGLVIWAERYDRETADLFSLQDEVSLAVVKALKIRLLSAPDQAPRIDPLAYEMYLRARSTVTNWLGARDTTLLEAAVQCAPRFAAAWAELAMSRAILANEPALGHAEATRLREGARDAADRALALEPHAAFAHAALALLEPVCGAFAAAERNLERACQSAPNEPTILTRMSRWLRTVGRNKQALEFTERAHAIDPLQPNVVNDYASLLHDAGRMDEANELFDRAYSRWPEVLYTTLNPMMRAAFRSDWSRVDSLIARVRESGPQDPEIERIIERAMQFRYWNGALSEGALCELDEQLARTGTVQLVSAVYAASMGLTNEVFDRFERTSFRHLFEAGGRQLPGDFGLHWLFGDGGVVMPARRDTRFVRLCARLGLVRYWIESDRWPDCVDEVASDYDFKAEAHRLHGEALDR